MKKIILLIAFLLFCSTSYSQSGGRFSAEQIAKYNDVMMDIYNEIYAVALEYPELKNFDKSALIKNDHGIYSVDYEYVEFDGFRQLPKYKIGIEITNLNAPYAFVEKSGKFSFNYPLLGVKVHGYQVRELPTRHYDVQPLIIRSIDPITEEEQMELPLKLSIEPLKSHFDAGEDVEFTVTLTNVSEKRLKVKNLSGRTLYFLFNGQPWGAKEITSSGGRYKHTILKTGDSIQKRFKGEGSRYSEEFDVICTYAMTYQGVRPTATADIKIVR